MASASGTVLAQKSHGAPQRMRHVMRRAKDAVAGDVCREDLARVLVECLQHPRKKALVFQVQNRPQGDSL